MVDVARALILLVAIARAIHGRFVLGAVFGAIAALVLGSVFVASYAELSRHALSGEYGFHFVYMGPTMLPLGGRLWLPAAVQLALTAVTLVPAMAVLRTPAAPLTNVFLLVFMPNAIMAVMASLGAYMMWRQQAEFHEYWENPSLASTPPPASYAPLALLPAREEGALRSHERRYESPSGAPSSPTAVSLLIRNHSSERIHLVWLDAAGRRDTRPDALDRWLREAADPGLVIEASVGPGSAFVLTDDAGLAMCTLVVGTRDAMVDLEGPCR